MEDLPSEVMGNILSRLPVKTVIHCKCVCKKWQNLVNNPHFISLHLSTSPAGFMVQHDANIPDDGTPKILKWVEIEDKLDHHRLHHDPAINFDLNGYLNAPTLSTELIPVGSVNGLICIWHCGVNVNYILMSDPIAMHRGVNVDNVYICNPITREYLTLPRPQNYGYDCALIAYKFGVNSLTGEYKVLRIFQRGQPGRWSQSALEAEVYTLGTSRWRSLSRVPYWLGRGLGRLYTPFVNGCFHWKFFDLDTPERILTFDLDKETFQLFPSLPIEPENAWSENLGVFKGCLCISYTYDSQFTIWVMKQHGIKESWHKELVITRADCARLDFRRMASFYVFGGLQDGTFLVVNNNKVLAYCPKSKTIEDLAVLSTHSILLTHHPSLIKLQGIDSERVQSF